MHVAGVFQHGSKHPEKAHRQTIGVSLAYSETRATLSNQALQMRIGLLPQRWKVPTLADTSLTVSPKAQLMSSPLLCTQPAPLNRQLCCSGG